MSKKILAIYYSQSGQLTDIIDQFMQPFEQAEIEVEKVRVQPIKRYPFPWSSKQFFSVMPASVLGTGAKLEDLDLKSNKYDLIVLGYQPWYLSPSIPTTSILQHPDFKKIAKNTPVISIIGARNMWLNAQEKVKKLLKETEAKLVGNIALVDRHNNYASAVSIMYWMFTGNKDRYLGVFPRPGVSENDILKAKQFGEETLAIWQREELGHLQQRLVDLKAVEVKTNLMFIEGRAGKLFSIWANLINKRKNKTLWLSIFKYYLLTALFIIAPIVLLINTLFFRPFLGKHIRRKKDYFLGIDKGE